MVVRAFGLAVMLFVAAGCGRTDAVPDSGGAVAPGSSSLAPAASGAGASGAGASAAATPGAGATGAGVPGPACPKTGHWSDCQVLARLEHAGLAPQKNAKVGDLPNLDERPMLFTVNSSGLAVYLFADTLSRRRAAASLDASLFIAPSRSLSMKNEATAIENDNLLAILFSRNELQRERVSDALTAGPPQP